MKLRGAICSFWLVLGVATTPALADPLRLKVSKAFVVLDPQTSEPILEIEWQQDSRTHFGEFTIKHVGKTIEVRVDGVSLASPVLRGAIDGPSIQISGKLDLASMQQMAERLTAGSAKLEVEVKD